MTEREEPEKSTIKPSKACGGTVERTATAQGSSRAAAEDAALAAAQAAATRACHAKKCSGSNKCAYVEEKSSGSSAPLDPPVSPNTHTATMTTSGKCQCERP